LAIAGAFTPVLAKHSKSFSLVDCLSVGIDRMQRNFEPKICPSEIRPSESRIANINVKLPEEAIDLEEIEKEILLQALEKSGWNRTQAAKHRNISQEILVYRMEKFSPIPGVPQL
jgi:transcriptional regulator with PAS, ATPase and Fis domain